MKLKKYFSNKCYPNHPKSATAEEWAVVHKEERKKPFCFWLTSTAPSWINVKLMQLADIKHGFNYRFIKRHKYHLIDTKLGYGYHEIENRMLHGMFSLLVDFVEHEKAGWHYASLEKDDVRPSPRRGGLAHLKWEIGLLFDKDEGATDEQHGTLTPQALNAQTIKDLYLWWVDTRPARMDPWDDEDWEKAKWEINGDESIWEAMVNRTPEQKEAGAVHARKREAMEEAYEAEDEKMLLRLVKIRRSLWT